MKSIIYLMSIMLFIGIGFSCKHETKSVASKDSDSLVIKKESIDSIKSQVNAETQTNVTDAEKNISVGDSPKINIYNFYVTNRCPSCIAIEDATTKTLKTYFSKELKEGRIKRSIVNVDDEANKAIIEKYEVFGSGLLVVKSFQGKETLVDMTGDGFKYAKNKEEKFVEILKKQVEEFLK